MDKAVVYTSGPRHDARVITHMLRQVFEALYPGLGRKLIADSLEEHRDFVQGTGRDPKVVAQMTMLKFQRDPSEAQPTLFRITVEALDDPLGETMQ